MSAGNGGSLPLPGQYLPDVGVPKTQRDWNNLLEDVQFKFQAMQSAVGNNANTAASVALTPLYLGTWTNYTATAGFTPYYTKRGGMVSMGGAVTNLSVFPGSPNNMFTMPAGFRPASTEQFLQMAVGGAGGVATTGAVIIQIAPSGIVSFISGITGGGLTNNMAYISLSGITYGAAA